MMLRVRGTEELAWAAAYLGRLDRPTRDALRAQTRTWSGVLVREVIVRAASQPAPAMALAQSGKITQTRDGLVATFGATGAYRSGRRAIPVKRLVPFEFGADQQKYELYVSRHRVSRQAMRVRRRVQVQMQPRNRRGYAIFPAVAAATPTLVSMWVRAIADVAREAVR